MIRVKKQFAATRDDALDDDIRHFRCLVSYLYPYSKGYVRSLKRSPAFRAIASSLQRTYGQSAALIVSDLVSDLENNLGSLVEGIRLAMRRGTHVYIIALFSRVFEQFDDPLLAIEDIYVAYDEHARRKRKLEQIPNVNVIEANSAETLRPALKEARIE